MGVVMEDSRASTMCNHDTGSTNQMNVALIQRLCAKQGLYSTPELNEKLFLHFQNFCKIENLDRYSGVKALFLESNAIRIIEGLDSMLELRCLYLQNNNIHAIHDKSLLMCTEIVTLSLSNNFLHKIENISHLSNLTTLLIAQNRLRTLDDVQHLRQCQHLTTLDLSQNLIEDESIIDLLGELPELACLYLKGNPFVSQMRFYRKTTIAKCLQLNYLDDRPVFDMERRLVTAWINGGPDGELAERTCIGREKLQNIEDTMAARKRYENRVKAWKARQAQGESHIESNETAVDGVDCGENVEAEDQRCNINAETMARINVTYESVPFETRKSENMSLNVQEFGSNQTTVKDDESHSADKDHQCKQVIDEKNVQGDDEGAFVAMIESEEEAVSCEVQVEEAAIWEWTEERDRQLNELVLLHLYDFCNVARSLASREGSSAASSEECRKRFDQLHGRVSLIVITAEW